MGNRGLETVWLGRQPPTTERRRTKTFSLKGITLSGRGSPKECLISQRDTSAKGESL